MFDLGTSDAGLPNQMSAIDTRSFATGGTQGQPTGPKTPDQTWQGDATVPGAGSGAPGTYDDHPFTIGPNDGDAAATIRVTWADSTDDFDLQVLKKAADGSTTVVGTSASGNTTSEQVMLTNPEPGDYIVRSDNYAALPGTTYEGSVTFTQRTVDPAKTESASYVGYCGACDFLNTRPFDNGIATNVGGNWHKACRAATSRRSRSTPSTPRPCT